MAEPVSLMNAIVVHEFGGPQVLRYEQVARPSPGPGEVLVRVEAAGVNPPDGYSRSGFTTIPPALRPVLERPFTPGTDVAGVVEALGDGAEGWAIGDVVHGLLRFPTTPGAAKGYAQWTTAPVGDLAPAPTSVEAIVAAALPMAGLTAWQYVFDHAQVRPGSTVLVNGAAGGVGHLIVQLARHAGADVIGVASGRHGRFLHGLGVAAFVDYTTTDVAAAVQDVDYVFDTVGGPHGYRLLPVLRDGGRLLPVFFGEYDPARAAARGIVLGGAQVHSDGGQLAELATLVDNGAVRVHVEAVYPLADAAAAHERLEQGHLQGKLVLRVDHD